MYQVIDLDTDEQVSVHRRLPPAQKAARRRRAYAINLVEYDHPSGEYEFISRIEYCEPYDGDDSRAAQACGEAA